MVPGFLFQQSKREIFDIHGLMLVTYLEVDPVPDHGPSND
jgi:hypothetical protein